MLHVKDSYILLLLCVAPVVARPSRSPPRQPPRALAAPALCAAPGVSITHVIPAESAYTLAHTRPPLLRLSDGTGPEGSRGVKKARGGGRVVHPVDAGRKSGDVMHGQNVIPAHHSPSRAWPFSTGLVSSAVKAEAASWRGGTGEGEHTPRTALSNPPLGSGQFAEPPAQDVIPAPRRRTRVTLLAGVAGKRRAGDARGDEQEEGGDVGGGQQDEGERWAGTSPLNPPLYVQDVRRTRLAFLAG
ncbi:hypothetical protein C8R47DRAFT_1229914 [Mycena vitilis]|nr:hypothetical protein C8R47DRAFT_1229914 [Mycena vitilis]